MEGSHEAAAERGRLKQQKIITDQRETVRKARFPGLIRKENEYMNEVQSYLQMMIESLRKKEAVLVKIIEKNKAQSDCIHDKEYAEIDWDTFNVLIAEKESLIERIDELDSGFESLYKRVRNELAEDPSSYKEDVSIMQELITKLTDQSVEIRTMEERNRVRIEKVLMGAKKEIRKSRKSMQAVSNYYKSMSAPDAGNSGLVDKKK